jgi:hypothetical protein
VDGVGSIFLDDDGFFFEESLDVDLVFAAMFDGDGLGVWRWFFRDVLESCLGVCVGECRGFFLGLVLVEFLFNEVTEFLGGEADGAVLVVLEGLVFFDDEVHDFFVDVCWSLCLMWACGGGVVFGVEEPVALAVGASAVVGAAAVFEDVAAVEALVWHGYLSCFFRPDGRLYPAVVFFGELKEMGGADDGHAWCLVDAEHFLNEAFSFGLVAADLDADEAGVVVDLGHGLLDELGLFGRGETMFQDEDPAVFDLVDDVCQFFLAVKMREGVFADEVERDLAWIVATHRAPRLRCFLPNSLIMVV